MFLINLQGKESIYEQIRSQIIRFIEAGILKPNDKLPSCRNLANELGINPNTVNKAYSELEKNGYIYTLNKKGVFVAKSLEQKTKQNDVAVIMMLETLKREGYSKQDIINKLEMIYKEEQDA